MANKTPPTPFKRLIELQARNVARERGMLQQLDTKVDRYEQEIRNLRQKNYGQQIELRAKEAQLKQMASQADDDAATIEQFRQQLLEANDRIKAHGMQETVYRQRIASAEERLQELQAICATTAGALRRSAGSSASSSGFATGADD